MKARARRPSSINVATKSANHQTNASSVHQFCWLTSIRDIHMLTHSIKGFLGNIFPMQCHRIVYWHNIKATEWRSLIDLYSIQFNWIEIIQCKNYIWCKNKPYVICNAYQNFQYDSNQQLFEMVKRFQFIP